MAISASLLPEFDHEMATSRTVIERVPEDKFGWKPHEKSMSAGRLASHIAEMPTWATTSISQDSLDLAGGYQPYEAGSRAELLALFDKNAAAARASIAGCSDELSIECRDPPVQFAPLQPHVLDEQSTRPSCHTKKLAGSDSSSAEPKWMRCLVRHPPVAPVEVIK